MATPSTPRDGAALLASPVRQRIVDTLSALQRRPRPVGDTPGMSARELAESVGLHVTTVRFHLDQLVAAGLVTATFRRQAGAGRPRKVYAARAGAPDESAATSTTALALLSDLLADVFAASRDGIDIGPAEVGARWSHDNVPALDGPPAASPGQWLGKVGRMVDVLSEWGYTPEVSTADGGRTVRVELADCPFRDAARRNTEIVCGIHRGLIRGAMDQLGEPGADISLEAFVTPHLCRAHLTTHHPFHPPSEGAPRT